MLNARRCWRFPFYQSVRAFGLSAKSAADTYAQLTERLADSAPEPAHYSRALATAFFEFAENNEYASICEAIFQTINTHLKGELHVLFVRNAKSILCQKDEIRLLAVFICKAFCGASPQLVVHTASFINSDIIANAVVEYYRNFVAYYTRQPIVDELAVRREVYLML